MAADSRSNYISEPPSDDEAAVNHASSDDREEHRAASRRYNLDSPSPTAVGARTDVAPDMSAQYEANYGAHRAGMAPEEVADYYTTWAEHYERDLHPGIYNGPTIIAGHVGQLYPEKRDRVRILDVAAGTGLVGTELYKRGFRLLDGLDPSRGMLDLCAEKNIYDNLICDFIGDKRLQTDDDVYDCVVTSGGFGESHIPCAALNEMVRIVKPGGHICLVMRREYLDYVDEYKGRLEEFMLNFAKAGKWDQIARHTVPNYSFNKEGVVYLFMVIGAGGVSIFDMTRTVVDKTASYFTIRDVYMTYLTHGDTYNLHTHDVTFSAGKTPMKGNEFYDHSLTSQDVFYGSRNASRKAEFVRIASSVYDARFDRRTYGTTYETSPTFRVTMSRMGQTSEGWVERKGSFHSDITSYKNLYVEIDFV